MTENIIQKNNKLWTAAVRITLVFVIVGAVFISGCGSKSSKKETSSVSVSKKFEVSVEEQQDIEEQQDKNAEPEIIDEGGAYEWVALKKIIYSEKGYYTGREEYEYNDYGQQIKLLKYNINNNMAVR